MVGVAAGGVVDLVESGVTGFLAKPDNLEDMEEFTGYVTLLLEDKDKRLEMGQAARRWAEGWSWEAATSKLRNIQYRRAIATHKANQEEQEEEELLQRYQEYRPDFA